MKYIDDKGNISVILCLVITVILAFAAYVVDIGVVYAEKIKLSNALDSAALAAALELPNNRDKAYDIAIEYLEKNNVNTENVNIVISNDNKSIEINGNKNVPHTFAKIFGVDSSNVETNSRVIIGSVKSATGGIRPFAVETFNYTYGDVVTIKEGAGDGYNGNYGVVALGGSGASTAKYNVLYGYKGTLKVGDWIDTEPGNMSSVVSTVKNYIRNDYSTFDNFTRDSLRIWTMPLVDTLEVNGRGQVQVVGFAQFYVEGMTNNGGHTEITGRFLQYVVNGEIDADLVEYGAYGAKLVK